MAGSVRRFGLAMVAMAALLTSPGVRAQSILNYHGAPNRSGTYTVPHLTWERAAGLHADPDFDGRVAGHIYAQPLFWHFPQINRKLVVLATEDNVVYALDAHTGKVAWQKSLGSPVPRAALPCGNIGPLGITGTPVIDGIDEALYLDAMVDQEGAGAQHLVFGLALNDGAALAGFPVNVAQALGKTGLSFAPRFQNQRGALLIAGRTVYVPYGGHFGDCGDYHGWVVGVGLTGAHDVTAWRTRAAGGGVWAPGGISSDGHALFVATGNSKNADQWADGEAVLRLPFDLKPPADPHDFFAPADWKALDDRDADLGGANPLPIDVRDLDGGGHFVLALGKDGKAYLLDRDNLGGIGGSLVAQTVARRAIITAPAVYPGRDAVFVAFEGPGSDCPNSVANPGLTVLKIEAHPAPKISTAWCGAISGRGAPIATISDDDTSPIVWMVGAEGDNRLHGFRGDTGVPVFTGEPLTGLRHFVTVVAADNRLFVAADDRVYAFTP